MGRKPKFTLRDLEYAMRYAAEMMDAEEYGGDEKVSAEAAYREVAKRLRSMADGVSLKILKGIVGDKA